MLDFPRWKIASIVGLLVFLMALAVPSVVPDSVVARWGPLAKLPRISLGLDLAGGSYLLLEGNTNELFRGRVDAMRGNIADAMARAPAIETSDIATDNGRLSFLLRDVTKLDAARERLNGLTKGVGLTGQRDWNLSVVDASRIVMTPTDAGNAAAIDDAMKTATEIVRTRIDKLGTKEPSIVRQGTSRIVVQVPGLKDPQALKELIGKTAKLEFKMVDDTPVDPNSGIVPAGSQALSYAEGAAGQKILVKRRAIITGDQLTGAKQEYSQDGTNRPVVGFSFDSTAGKTFARITQANVGKRFAVVVDDLVISAPTIQTPIMGGSGIITGSFTVESANALAIALGSGKLSLPLTVVDERSVGADLGADSIHAGILACSIAVALVIVFMILTYGRFGFYANYAVIINVVVIMRVPAARIGMQTLPGAAGCVLATKNLRAALRYSSTIFSTSARLSGA